MTIEIDEQIKNHILNDCETYFRKVARVFGQFLMNYEKVHGKVSEIDYAHLESVFFKVLHQLIQDCVIVARGTITPENMGFSEIGQLKAK